MMTRMGNMIKPSTGAWTPWANGTGFYAEYNPTDTAARTMNGSNVSALAASHGTGVLSAATSGQQPSLSGIGMVFGTDDRLSPSHWPAGDYEVFIIAAPYDIGFWRTLFWNSDSNHPILIEDSSYRLGAYDSGFIDSGLTWPAFATKLLYSRVHSAGVDFALNGDEIAETTATMAPLAPALIGAYAGGQQFGTIHRIFIRDASAGALSDAERAKWEGFVAWNTMGDGSLLVAGHPYKNAPPGVTVEPSVWTQVWNSNFSGGTIPWAQRGLTGSMAGADYSYALSPTVGWNPRPRFEIGEPKGAKENNRWAFAMDPNHAWPSGYTTVYPNGLAEIVSGKLRVRAIPRPAALDGLIPNRWHTVAPGYTYSDSGVAHPWITQQPTSQHYIQVGGDYAIEVPITFTAGKASFPGFYILATNYIHRLMEKDIMEAQGDEPHKSSFNLIVNGTGVPIGAWWFADRGKGNLAGSEHIYRMEFSNGVLTAFVDGEIIGTHTIADWYNPVMAETIPAAIWPKLDFYLIIQNQSLDWDDQWMDGGGEAGGGAPNPSHATWPTQDGVAPRGYQDLFIGDIKVFKKTTGNTTRLSGRGFPLGGSTAWLPPNIGSVAPTVVMDLAGNRHYAFGENVHQRTNVVPRGELVPGDVGYDLVGPASGAAFSRRGVWAIKATVPSDVTTPLSVGDRWAFIYLSPTQVIAGNSLSQPTINHGLSPGDPITIVMYTGADLNATKLACTGNGGTIASGSVYSEYMGEHARVGISSFGLYPCPVQPTLLAWYDTTTYPGDSAMNTLVGNFNTSA